MAKIAEIAKIAKNDDFFNFWQNCQILAEIRQKYRKIPEIRAETPGRRAEGHVFSYMVPIILEDPYRITHYLGTAPLETGLPGPSARRFLQNPKNRVSGVLAAKIHNFIDFINFIIIY